MLSTAGPFPLSHWRILTLTGKDVAPFLTRLLTVKPPKTASGGAVYGALLNPQGKIQHELFLHARPDASWQVECVAEYADLLVRRLSMLKLRDDVTIVTQPLIPLIGATAIAGSFEDPRLSGVWRSTVAPAPQTPIAYDAWRIASGLPEQGRDYGFEERWPTDVNMDVLGGVNTQKGCFIGQEVVSRMIRKGGIKRRTMRVTSDEDLITGPVTGSDGMPLGEITSVAGRTGLAMLRTDRLNAETRIITQTGAALFLPDREVSDNA